MALSVFGCSNVGNAVEGDSPQQAIDNFNNMSPEDQIKMIETSPMNAADKEKKIAEIKQKAGIK